MLQLFGNIQNIKFSIICDSWFVKTPQLCHPQIGGREGGLEHSPGSLWQTEVKPEAALQQTL